MGLFSLYCRRIKAAVSRSRPQVIPDSPAMTTETTASPVETTAPPQEITPSPRRRLRPWRYFLPSLALLSALSIAGTAAYFSIIGLTALFPGAFIPIIVMGGVLECGKLISALWLHQNWERCPRLMKYYLTCAVIVLMGITSIGIFGFLSKSHLEHQKGAIEEKALIQQFDDKIAFENSLITQYTGNVEKLNKQIGSFNTFKKEDIETEEKLLQEIYKNLEGNIKIEQQRIEAFSTRLTALEAERLTIEQGSSFSKRSKLEKLAERQAEERADIKNNSAKAAANIDTFRAKADDQVSQLREKIDSLRSQSSSTKGGSLKDIDKYNSSISASQKKIDDLNTEKFKLGYKLREIQVEVGPIKYVAELISDLTGKEIAVDGAVKVLIISIIFVFDPLAVLMLLASTSSLRFNFLSAHEKLKCASKWR